MIFFRNETDILDRSWESMGKHGKAKINDKHWYVVLISDVIRETSWNWHDTEMIWDDTMMIFPEIYWCDWDWLGLMIDWNWLGDFRKYNHNTFGLVWVGPCASRLLPGYDARLFWALFVVRWTSSFFQIHQPERRLCWGDVIFVKTLSPIMADCDLDWYLTPSDYHLTPSDTIWHQVSTWSTCNQWYPC